MLLNTISPENKGYGVSAFLFFCTISGTISSAALGAWVNTYDPKNNPKYYGYFICFFVLFSYIGSLPFFVLAGR